MTRLARRTATRLPVIGRIRGGQARPIGDHEFIAQLNQFLARRHNDVAGAGTA
jgi:hypothetical protein